MEQELIPRPEYLDRIRPHIGSDTVKVITGMRRSGKSGLLRLISKELLEQGRIIESQIVSINLEDAAMRGVRDVNRLLCEIDRRLPQDGTRVYLFLDEVQHISGWEKTIAQIRNKVADIYITSSDIGMISEYQAHTSFPCEFFHVYPLSFTEFLYAYRMVYPDALIKDIFHTYFQSGGLPYLLQLDFDPALSRRYLQDTFTAIEFNDIMQHGTVRDPELLERILHFVMENVGRHFSARALERVCRDEDRSVSVSTIVSYLRMAAGACLYYPVRQSLRGTENLSLSEKYYAADHGLMQAVLSSEARNVQRTLENIVYLELRRRGYEVTAQDKGSRRITFVANVDSERIYVQVAYLIGSTEARDRLFGAYDSVRDHFPKMVVSMDEENMSKNGIRHYNVRDFLLSGAWSW